jgi:cytochrome c
MTHAMHALFRCAATAGVVLALGLLLTAAPAVAQDGKALYTAKGCAACHGPTGAQTLMPVYPKIAGQNADYVVAQLKAFKAQERKSGQSALMWGMAAPLSDAEITAIAKWLQTQK